MGLDNSYFLTTFVKLTVQVLWNDPSSIGGLSAGCSEARDLFDLGNRRHEGRYVAKLGHVADDRIVITDHEVISGTGKIDEVQKFTPLYQLSDPQYVGLDLGRRAGGTLKAADKMARQTGSSVWREVSNNRFFPVKLRQLRNSPYRGSDTV